MKILHESSENEMVAVFLYGELNSERWKNKILEIMDDKNIDKRIVLNPKLNDVNENKARTYLLRKFRGYNDKEIFENFPKTINWNWAILNKDDILKIKYIEYDYWEELSKGTRYAKDSVENIRNNVEIFGVKNDNFLKLADYIKKGTSFNPLIITAPYENKEKMIVLEGHARLTAINLAIEYVSAIKVLIGFAEEEQLTAWCKY
jgi:hypothetical protein